MNTAVSDVRLVMEPPARSHQGQYVYSGIPQQVYFQVASNSFHASGESVRQKDISISAIEAQAAIPKGMYLHERQLRYNALNAAEKSLKHLHHLNPVQLQENEFLKQPTEKINNYHFNGRETLAAATNLHNEPHNGNLGVVLVENVPECLPCLPINECLDIDAGRSTTQYESTQQIRAERFHAYQHGHQFAFETECSSENRVMHLKPSSYQPQTTCIPVTRDNKVHLAFNSVQSSKTIQMGPRYPVNVQNPRVPNTAGEPKHHSHPNWLNPAPVTYEGFPEHGNNGIYQPSRAPHPHFHSYSQGRSYSVLEPESDLNSVQRQPPDVVVPNGVQTTAPFSYSEEPFVHHFSGGSNRPLAQQMVADFPSASAFRSQTSTAVAAVGIHSTVPGKSSVNPSHLEDNSPLSRGEYQKHPNHVYCETPKYVSAALPVHPINAMPTDENIAAHPPARQLPVYTQEDPVENGCQKADFPIRIVYVPSDSASCLTAPRPCYTGNANGQSCPAHVFNAREARPSVSVSASQPFHTNGEVQYTTSYASAPNSICGSSKVKSLFQPPSQGYCYPAGETCSTPNHRIDLMSSVHHKTPSYSKSNAMMAAPLDRPNYGAQAIRQPASTQVLTTSNTHFGLINGYVPSGSNNISRSENSAFRKIVHYQDAGKDQDDPHSRVDSLIAPKQQQHDNNSGDSFKPSHGSPSRWSNNFSLHASPHLGRGYPTAMLRNPTVCGSSIATKEPSCYISVDSKPQVDNEKEQFKFSDTRKCQEIVQSHVEGKMPCIEQEQPDSKLEKLTKFVVGVESKIQWNKVNNNNNKNKSNGSDMKDLQIVSVSSTRSPRDDSTTSPFNSSGSESEDPFCMIRLERVYYSSNTVPSRHCQSSTTSLEQGSKLVEYNVDRQKRKFSSLPGETHQTTANIGHSSRSKTSAVKKVRKTSHVSVAGSVKRKANVSSAIIDGVCGVKRKKMEKTKSIIPQEGTVITALGKVKTSLEILSTNNLTVRLEDVKQKSEKKETRIICERIRKRCSRKLRINS